MEIVCCLFRIVMCKWCRYSKAKAGELLREGCWLTLMLLMVSFLAVSCKCPEAEQATPKPQANSQVQSREFAVVNFGVVDEAEVDALARFVEELNRPGNDIDAITKIVFFSPTRAEVYFLWAGRFHGGSLELAKQNGTWVVTHEVRYP